MTLKEIKNTIAQDITRYSFEECRTLNRYANLEKVGLSRGVYGVNGALLRDVTTGNLYKITSRNSVLLFFV